MNNTEENFILLDAEGRILLFNNHFQKMYTLYFGRPVVKGNSLVDHAQPHRRQLVKDILSRVLKGEVVESEIEFTIPEGKVHTYTARYKPAFNEEGKIGGVFLVVKDITRSKRAEQQLVSNEQRFRRLVENGNEVIAILSPSIQPTYISPSVNRVLGYTPEELMAMDVLTLVYPEDVSIIKSALEIAMANPGVPGEGHIVRALHKDQTWRWLEASLTNMLHDPAIGGIVDNFRDITEKKLADQALRDSEEKTRLIMNAALDAIICMDKKGIITFWNPQAEKIFGWTAEEVMGKALSETIIPAEFREQHNRGLEAYAKTGEAKVLNRILELSAVKKNNAEFPVELTVLPIKQGNDQFFCAFLRDITRRKTAEQQLNKRAEELTTSNAELEQFAYVASHDLQEPLRMVSSFLQLLEKKYESQLDATAQQYIQFAVDGSERMKRLILDLLEYSRVNTNKEQRCMVNFSDIITQVLATYACKIKESNAIVKTSLMPEAKVSRFQMTQLFQNLVGNALKYNRSAQPEIEIGYEEKADHLQFFVKDNGIGIDPKFYERVFIIFQRLHTKNQFSGTGIGLAICKKIVEKHEGRIWVESEPGRGSTFYFTIKK